MFTSFSRHHVAGSPNPLAPTKTLIKKRTCFRKSFFFSASLQGLLAVRFFDAYQQAYRAALKIGRAAAYALKIDPKISTARPGLRRRPL